MDKTEENKLLRERIEYLKERKNILSDRELAKRSGLGATSINSIVNRKSIPGLDTIRKLADGFGISVLEFLDYYPYNKAPDQKNEKNEVEKIKKELDDLKKELLRLKKAE